MGNNVNANLKDLDTKKMSFIKNICDFCDTDNVSVLQKVSFLGQSFTFVKCNSCGLVYQNPLLDKESRNYVYSTIDYWDHKNSKSKNNTMLNYYSYIDETEIRKLNFYMRLEWLKKYIPQKSIILDVACADGLFVDILNKNGYTAEGIDISASMIELGKKKYNASLYQGDIENDWQLGKKFDAITCFAALSNFISFSAVLKNIKNHLTENGLFFFNFGDYTRLLSKMMGSRLYLFRPTVATIYSKKIIEKYLKKYGFEIIEISNDQQIFSVARLLGFLRIPFSLKIMETLKLNDLTVKMKFLTGYCACAKLKK
ncbi:MAG TPA: methyltransferase domain-containing protein [bacterium]|nr:methyltransferase domain-containing protein [bacterium]